MVLTSASTFGRAVMSHVASDRLDRRVFCLQLTKCHVIPPAGEDLGTFGSEPDCELPTDPRRATRHHNGTVAPGTASRARVSSTGASLSGHCSLQFQLGTRAIEITAYGRYGECSAGALKRNAAVPSLD